MVIAYLTPLGWRYVSCAVLYMLPRFVAAEGRLSPDGRCRRPGVGSPPPADARTVAVAWPDPAAVALTFNALGSLAAMFYYPVGGYIADSIPREKRGRIMAGVGSGMSIGITGVGRASGFLIFLPTAIGSIVGGLIYSVDPIYPWLLQGIVLTVGLPDDIPAHPQPREGLRIGNPRMSVEVSTR